MLHQLAQLKLNAELNEAIAEASVYEEEAQLEVLSPLPTNPKTVSTLLQFAPSPDVSLLPRVYHNYMLPTANRKRHDGVVPTTYAAQSVDLCSTIFSELAPTFFNNCLLTRPVWDSAMPAMSQLAK